MRSRSETETLFVQLRQLADHFARNFRCSVKNLFSLLIKYECGSCVCVCVCVCVWTVCV